jgi:cytochrome c oxidase cbb3-type subunit 1
MMTIGSVYSLLPRVYNSDSMYSTKLIDVHFWTSTIGVVLYAVSMWIAGVTEGLMWRAVNDDGTLTYSFVESIKAVHPYHGLRLLGGLLFFSGMLIMAYNVWKTVSIRKPEPIAVMDPA